MKTTQQLDKTQQAFLGALAPHLRHAETYTLNGITELASRQHPIWAAATIDGHAITKFQFLWSLEVLGTLFQRGGGEMEWDRVLYTSQHILFDNWIRHHFATNRPWGQHTCWLLKPFIWHLGPGIVNMKHSIYTLMREWECTDSLGYYNLYNLSRAYSEITNGNLLNDRPDQIRRIVENNPSLKNTSYATRIAA
jgi:hypothetical protein